MDELTLEIGEQISQVLKQRLPKWRGTPLDLKRGVEVYQAFMGTPTWSETMSLQDAKERAPREVGVYRIRDHGKVVYVGKAVQDDQGLRKRIGEHARGASTSNDKIRAGREKLTIEFTPTGSKDAANNLEAREIEKHDTRNRGWNKREESTVSSIPDESKRIVGGVAIGIVSDVTLFVIGGVAAEIRDAYQNPESISLLERCKRLLLAIWERLKVAFRDRSLRDIGSEFIVAIVSMLSAPLKMAKATVGKLVEVVRRLWMEFCSGNIKTLADWIAGSLKALLVILSVGAAVVLESQLTPLLVSVPGGEVLSAVIAAALAGVMIVVGNRAITGVVQSVSGIFQSAAQARQRREEIEKLCDKMIPQLIEDRERLQAFIDDHFQEREALLNCTFEDIQVAHYDGNTDDFLRGLVKINAAYAQELPWVNFEEFDEFMLDPDTSLKL